MQTALAWAQAHHIEAILASTLVHNFRFLRLLSVAPYPVHMSPARGGVVDVTIPLVPELLPAWSVVVPAGLRLSGVHRGAKRHMVKGCSRVVWRGTRQPVRGAAD
jgi:hypothetical protein